MKISNKNCLVILMLLGSYNFYSQSMETTEIERRMQICNVSGKEIMATYGKEQIVIAEDYDEFPISANHVLSIYSLHTGKAYMLYANQRLLGIVDANPNAKQRLPLDTQEFSIIFAKDGPTLHRLDEPITDDRPLAGARIYRALKNYNCHVGCPPKSILGLLYWEDYSPEELKTSYEILKLKWHPDTSKEPMAKEVFPLIKWAYEKLTKKNDSALSP